MKHKTAEQTIKENSHIGFYDTDREENMYGERDVLILLRKQENKFTPVISEEEIDWDNLERGKNCNGRYCSDDCAEANYRQ